MECEPALARVLVIVPAFNEEESLGCVLDALAPYRGWLDILVVDDGSTDSTATVACGHGATVARLPFNLGPGGAIRAGLRFARRAGYRRAVQFDADGQHDAAMIERIVAPLERGEADLVVGSRFGAGYSCAVGTIRGGAMRLLRVVVSRVAGKKLTDTSSGFRAFNERAIELFAANYPVEYLDTVEALFLGFYAGLRIMEVPVQMHERLGGRPSHRNLQLVYHYLRMMLLIVLTLRRQERAG